MNGSYGYALGAMLCFGLADVIYKRAASAGASPHHLLMVQSWVFLPSVTLYGLATGSLTVVPGSLWGSFAGFFMWLGFFNFAHSLRSGQVSSNAPIFRLSFIITAVLAIILLKEPLTASKLVGIGFAVLAVWLLLAVPSPGGAEGGGDRRSSMWRVVIATIATGIGNLLYKFGLAASATPASLIVMQAAVVVTASTVLTYWTDRRIRPSAAALRHAPLAGIVLAVAFVLLVESLVGGEASRMVPISQMGLAISAILGFAFLHERLSPRKALGLSAALIALAGFLFG